MYEVAGRTDMDLDGIGELGDWAGEAQESRVYGAGFAAKVFY